MSKDLENHMVLGTRWNGHPNDPSAPDETRPEGCTCSYQTEEMDHSEPSDDHDPLNDRCDLNQPAEEGCTCKAQDGTYLREHDPENLYCPLTECPDCEHLMVDHDAVNGCQVELGDGYRYGVKQAMGLCSCKNKGPYVH